MAEPAVVERAVKAYEDERRRVAAKAINEKASVEKRIADLTRKITRLNQMLIDELGDEEENSRTVKQAAEFYQSDGRGSHTFEARADVWWEHVTGQLQQQHGQEQPDRD